MPGGSVAHRKTTRKLPFLYSKATENSVIKGETSTISRKLLSGALRFWLGESGCGGDHVQLVVETKGSF
jgi:hypothetical protein